MQIRCGLTSPIASINIFGEGILPNRVMWVPAASAARKSNAQPNAWANGRNETIRLPLKCSLDCTPKSTFPVRLFIVSMTPLLNPVVPEV